MGLYAKVGRASAVVLLVALPAGLQAAAPARPVLDQALVERWMGTLSNWGRWGKDDELGTLNLITQAKRRSAMALARKGIVVSMERTVVLTAPEPDEAKGVPTGHGFYSIHFRTFDASDPRHNGGFSSDVQSYAPHGVGTHVDALCHDSDGHGRLYNGRDLKQTVKPDTGCAKTGITVWKQGVVTRGVLVDITRLKGYARPPGSPVLVEDIEAWERQTGLKISAGDALFAYNPGPVRNGRPSSGGFDLTVLPLMKARGVAITGGFAQTPGSPLGGQVPGMMSADHRLALAAMGMPLLDGADLGPVAEAAAKEGRWEFLLTIAPVAVPGATGQMVNPLAMF